MPMPTPPVRSTDPLLAWRAEFPILDTCTYLVSHSLGAMPRRARTYLEQFANEWDGRGVRAWHEGWWEIGRETGNLLAPLLGVAPDTITMHQNATVAQAIIASCFTFDGPRRRVVMQDLDFPTNHYLFEAWRRYGADVVLVPSDNLMQAPIDRLVEAIDERTVLVPLSLVLFRSACLQDVAPVVARAHEVGARVILDVYQATGTVPMDLASLGVDFAVGGSVKWLCGGPGAGYLYVRPDLIGALQPAATGWAAHAAPFAFETGAIRPAAGVERFQSGTPNVPSLYSARAGYENRRGSRRARDSGPLAPAHPPAHRRGAGARVAGQHADDRRGARRNPSCSTSPTGRGSLRRCWPRVSSWTTAPARVSGWPRISTTTRPTSTARSA